MYDFVVDGLGKNVIVEENEGELEMKKYELSAFVNFDNCFESQFPGGGEVGVLNRVYDHLKGMCASGDNVLLGISLVEGGHRRSMGSYVYMHDIINPIGRSRGIYYFTYSGSLEEAEEYIERSGMASDLTITISYNCNALRGMEFAIDSFTYTFKDSNVVDLSKSEESREKAPEGPSDALEDFGTKEDLETLLEVMRCLRDDVNGELNDSCVAGVRLVSVRAVDAPGAANYFRRARKDIDERTGLVRLSEIETNEFLDPEIRVVVPYLSLRAYLKTGEKGLFARQMEKAQREVMKDFEK